MSLSQRCLAGLLSAVLLTGGGVLLLRGGLYGLSMFIVIPVCLGALAAWVFRPETARRAALVGGGALMAATVSFLLLGIEGAICIVMSWPLVLPLGALGGWLVFQYKPDRLRAGGMAILLFVPSASVTWDVNARPPVFAVRTAVEIAAPPERVWKHVVSFSELPVPHEWYFRGGLAYPQRARIEGSGPGAVRYCEFSTGPFVEPIETWDEPRLLRFRVAANPAPMHEWSPYAKVLPKHLHGYLVSEHGQFRLTALANGHTLLEGTTWYRHGLWPAEYWRWWSDGIIHRIHLRVLAHIRTLAEGNGEEERVP